MPSQLHTFHAFKRLSGEHLVTLDDEGFKRLQRSVLEISFDVMEFCDKHDIEYLLIGGSCLGAVRHKGMIPWDDDVDFGMSRDSFEKFRELFPDSELAEKYNLMIPGETPGYVLLLAQIQAKNTVFRGKDDFLDESGIPVDIFMIEDVPDNRLARKIHGFSCLAFGFLQSARKFAEYPDHYRKLAENNPQLLRAVNTKIRIGRFLKPLSLDTWTRMTSKMNGLYRNPKATCVTMPADENHYFGALQPREQLLPASTGVFEDREVALPNNQSEYLAFTYGEDYMTPPKEGNRETHLILEIDFGELGKDTAVSNSTV